MTPTTDDVLNLLRKLPTGEIRNAAIITDVLPVLADWLGYRRDWLRFDYVWATARGRVRLQDAAVIHPETDIPILVFEVKYAVPLQFESSWMADLGTSQDETGALGAVLISSGYIAISADSEREDVVAQVQRVPIRDLTVGRLDKLRDMLSAEVLPRRLTVARTPLERNECAERLQSLTTAIDPSDKGTQLEELAKWLFEGAGGFVVKHRRLRTRSSEIDLVVEWVGTDRRRFFDDYGRYILVECKNWSNPVGAREVRDFVMKLVKTKVQIGILFAMRGITAGNGGEDAIREVQFCHDVLGVSVLVVAEDEIAAICNGGSLHEILDEKMDRLRFDLRS